MSSILVDRHQALVSITLNRPEERNALNEELIEELSSLLDELLQDDEVSVVLLSGSGTEAFSAGADMKQLAKASDEELSQALASTRRLFRSLANLRKPTVAAVNGLAHGGGAELACSCDLRIGSPSASFRFPGVAYGMAVGTWHLPTVVGLPKAKEILFTAQEIDAREAFRIGLLNRLVEEERLEEEARTMALQIASHPPQVVQAVKSLLNAGVGAPLQQRFFREIYSNQERRVNEQLSLHFERFLGEP